MRVFVKYKDAGFWWFRIFGYGICNKNFKVHGLLFSERNGYTKTLKIGNWSFKILNPKQSLTH